MKTATIDDERTNGQLARCQRLSRVHFAGASATLQIIPVRSELPVVCALTPAWMFEQNPKPSPPTTA